MLRVVGLVEDFLDTKMNENGQSKVMMYTEVLNFMEGLGVKDKKDKEVLLNQALKSKHTSNTAKWDELSKYISGGIK